MPPMVSTFGHRHDMSCPTKNHHMLHTWRIFHRIIDDSLQFQDLTPTITTISCDDDFGFAIFQVSSHKPLGELRVPFQYPVPFLVPKELAGNAGPERFWVSERISLEGDVLFLRLVCLLCG